MNSISLLNNYCQQKQINIPEYTTIECEGPSHLPVFTMKMNVDEYEFIATGSSKKAARYECASLAVKKLNIDQYFKDQVKKVYKYRICDVETSLEDIWNDEANELVLVIKRYNIEQNEQEIKTIKMVKL